MASPSASIEKKELNAIHTEEKTINTNQNTNHDTRKRPSEESSEKRLDVEQFDCPLCSSLLFEPIVTCCGHVFCRRCVLRAMDHDNKCPLCRVVIHVTPEHGICKFIEQIIEQMFPEQLAIRQKEEKQALDSQKFQLPLFLLGDTCLFPGMSMPLHIFEPKYRLLVRRCLEGGKRFGIVPTLDGKSLAKVGTTAYIENHWLFPDGRSMVMTVGEKRFEVGPVTDQDGYKVASVQYIKEDPMEADEQSYVNLLYDEVLDTFKSKTSNLSKEQLKEKYGEQPTEVVAFSFWIAGILPVTSEQKYELLAMTSTRDRLEKIKTYLESFNLTTGCSIM
eukprot:TRINITY_DN3162_c0_g1_i1.p1 TRINITY_DN3162_c0_g1~~TRINITY_DN3162_c0_g1_i1.p1  ORF type:complete len:333 (-),score=51.28 TRINITY_DN3162_c0_g1_i1:83-1081(-)